MDDDGQLGEGQDQQEDRNDCGHWLSMRGAVLI